MMDLLALLTLSLLPWLARREPIEQVKPGSNVYAGRHRAEVVTDPGSPDLHLATIYLRSGRLRVWRRKP
jgi:hypothetical protein